MCWSKTACDAGVDLAAEAAAAVAAATDVIGAGGDRSSEVKLNCSQWEALLGPAAGVRGDNNPFTCCQDGEHMPDAMVGENADGDMRTDGEGTAMGGTARKAAGTCGCGALKAGTAGVGPVGRTRGANGVRAPKLAAALAAAWAAVDTGKDKARGAEGLGLTGARTATGTGRGRPAMGGTADQAMGAKLGDRSAASAVGAGETATGAMRPGVGVEAAGGGATAPRRSGGRLPVTTEPDAVDAPAGRGVMLLGKGTVKVPHDKFARGVADAGADGACVGRRAGDASWATASDHQSGSSASAKVVSL